MEWNGAVSSRNRASDFMFVVANRARRGGNKCYFTKPTPPERF